jgi:serine/threonine-protein kinase RsbW
VAYGRGIGTEILLSEVFDRSRVTALRHVVTSTVATAGLSGDRLDDFVVAVNELLTNAVRHGGGSGEVLVWCEHGSVVCEVRDKGTGLRTPPPDPAERPVANQPGGWGLWLAGRLTDTLELSTGAEGTSVRISARASR